MLTPLEIEDFKNSNVEALVFRLGVTSKQLIISTNAKKPHVEHIKTIIEDVEKLKKVILEKQGNL